MLSGDYKQRKVYFQWAKEITDRRIAEAKAAIEEMLRGRGDGEQPSLNEEEYISLFLAMQPPLPYGARPVSEPLFRWDTTATQFIAIQKAMGIPVYIKWKEDGRVSFFDIYIGEEEIDSIESRFPELGKVAENRKPYLPIRP